jgi:predicted phage terminase large subunit-like protein
MSEPRAAEAELLRLLELAAEDGPGEILASVPLISPKYERPSHLRALAEVLHRVETVGKVRACCSVPPRHAKTETLMHAIARLIARRPEWTIGYVTYEAGVAQSKSRKMRDLAHAIGIELRGDAQRLSEWRTPKGGGLLATGVGGPLTSHGLDFLVVDDPFKNREEAESPLIRQRIHEWFTSTALTRLEPDGSALVNMTRWHDDDLIGRLERDVEVLWNVINLPALSAKGEPLWPERWTAEALDERRRLVGPYDWASLYQGEPRPRGGRLFHDPARYEFPDFTGARLAIACDPAASEKTSADHSAAVVVAARGRGIDQVVDVLEVYRAQIEVPRLVQELHRLQRRWKAPVFVESAGGFKAVAQALRAIDPKLRVVEVPPLGDKFTRAQPVAAAWNDGRVRLPVRATWLDAFLGEVQQFTGVRDREDDQVDALAHAFNAVNQRAPALVRGARAVGGLARGVPWK